MPSDAEELEEGELPAPHQAEEAPREARRQGKKKRTLAEANKGSAQDYFDIYGPDVCSKVGPLPVQDLNGLVTWAIGQAVSPPWVFLKNKPLVRKVVMLLVSGIDWQMWEEAREHLKQTREVFSSVLAVAAVSRPTTAQTVRWLLSCQLSKAAAKKQKKKQRHNTPPFPPSHYILDLKTMQNMNYPLPEMLDTGEMQLPEGFRATEPHQGEEKERIVAVDCEMCRTEEGLELTRISLIDANETVLLDELVKPKNEILDYVTRYSGITEEMLAGVTTTLEDARNKFMQIVSDRTLLVGHALENDLRALRVVHANCLDTALLYPHPKGPPFRSGLKFLTEKFLKKSIQSESHDSIEDARAALLLVQLKIKHGPNWGMPGEDTNSEPLVTVLDRCGRRCALVDSPGSLNKHAHGSAAAIAALDTESSVTQVRKEDVDFIWGHWPDVSQFQCHRADCRRIVTSQGTPLPTIPAACDDTTDELPQVLHGLDRQVGLLWKNLPPNTLLMIATGHGDLAEVKRGHESKCRRMTDPPLDNLPRWTHEDDTQLKAADERVKKGLLLVAVKP